MLDVPDQYFVAGILIERRRVRTPATESAGLRETPAVASGTFGDMGGWHCATPKPSSKPTAQGKEREEAEGLREVEPVREHGRPEWPAI